MKSKNLVTLVIAIFCALNFGFSQSIFTNEIATNSPNTDNPYILGQITNINLTVSGIGRGPDINGNNANNRYNARDWNLTTFDSGDYFYFTLTPDIGYEIDYTNFVFNTERSNTGPVEISVRSSLDGFTSNIGVPTIGGPGTVTQSTIDLSNSTFQNISSSITFRIYAWGGSNTNGTFSVNDFTFNGAVTPLPCPAPAVTWDGTSWSPASGPNASIPAIINGNYNTGIDNSFTACSLIVNNNSTLTVDDNTYIEIENDITVDAGSTIDVQPYGAIVQNNDFGVVTNNGSMTVEKLTAQMDAWYEYTYWSSPVTGETISGAISDSDPNRRFIFNAQNYLDATSESGNDNTATLGQDDIDDNGDDWQLVNGGTIMQAGVGYATTLTDFAYSTAPGTSNKQFRFTFDGDFNNGIITVPVYRNDSELNDNNWNFIGNPYPSAIDADSFFAANNYDATTNPTGSLEGAIYLWSQNTPPSRSNNGNQDVNFSDDDYAIINGSGEIAGGDGNTPYRAIPSGQGFFVTYSNTGNVLNTTGSVNEGEVVFNNAMRIVDLNSNNLFFKGSNKKNNTTTNKANKLWLNLTSDNGVFNQTLISYLKNATLKDDGSYFDAIKNPQAGVSASVYSLIKNSDKKFAIQGKAPGDLTKTETINLGFKTSIGVATLYKLSIAKLQGDFLSNNTIYLKDRLLKKTHDLSNSDYTFTSEVGEFNKRFEIVFNKKELNNKNNFVSIINLGNKQVNFKASDDLNINSVIIYDALIGKALYNFKGHTNSETFTLPHLSKTIYIAQIELSNGIIVTKKIVVK